MPFLFFIPLIFFWVVIYWTVKYPAQAVGRLIVRHNPNRLYDAALCIVLTLLLLSLVFAVVVYAKDYLTHEPYPYSMDDRATIVAVILGPPVLLAMFKSTRRAAQAIRTADGFH